jgi:parvulin-like peptidyl-prolyl isomerase
MRRSDPKQTATSLTHSGRRFTTVCLAIAVLGTCVAIRWIDGPDSASAQTVRRQTAARQPAAESSTTSVPTKPNVVAVVNGQEVTRGDLARECTRRHGKEVLESEVNKRLILEACKAQGIKITNAEIDAEIARMSNKFGLSTGRWLAMLKDERDISPFQYRRDIVWPTLALRRLAKDSLQVTREELEIAYESEHGAMVQARLISTQSRTKAEQIHAKAMANPERFDRLAKDHSEDENSAAARGLIPPIRQHVGDPQIVDIAFSMDEGEISPVIEAAGQFILLKCEQHLPPRDLGPEQRAQVMQELRDSIADKKLRTAGNDLFKKLQAEAQIVNVLNDKTQRGKFPGIAAIVNGTKVSMADLGEQCILRHGKEVLSAEINRRILVQALKRRSLEVQESDVKKEVRRAAESFGFVNSDGTINESGWLKHITDESGADVEVYVRDSVWPSIALKKLVSSQVKITDADLKKAFIANYGERVDVLAIVMSNQRTAHEVFDMARSNDSDKFFGELAHQYSIEPMSKANFGQVPPVRMHGGQPMLEKEAFALKPGEVSGVIATGDKYVVLRCLGRTEPVVKEMEVVKDELLDDIREKKLRVAMAKEFDRIRKSAQIDNFLEGTVQAGQGPMAQRMPGQTRAQPASARVKR